jgi:hypothetical protein
MPKAPSERPWPVAAGFREGLPDEGVAEPCEAGLGELVLPYPPRPALGCEVPWANAQHGVQTRMAINNPRRLTRIGGIPDFGCPPLWINHERESIRAQREQARSAVQP